MKRTLATLTTVVALGLTPIAASADAGTAEGGAVPSNCESSDHAQTMMDGDFASMHGQEGAAMSDHHGGMHSDADTMSALTNEANSTAMTALMQRGRANPAGGMH